MPKAAKAAGARGHRSITVDVERKSSDNLSQGIVGNQIYSGIAAREITVVGIAIDNVLEHSSLPGHNR